LDLLIEKFKFFDEYPYYCQITVSSITKTEFNSWVGFVESRMVELYMKFDTVKLTYRPYSKVTFNSRSNYPYSCFYWIALDITSIDLINANNAILDGISAWKKATSNDIHVKFIKKENLEPIESLTTQFDEESDDTSSKSDTNSETPGTSIISASDDEIKSRQELISEVESSTQKDSETDIPGVEEEIPSSVSKHTKMRTSIEAYNRIRWDKSLNVAEFTIGYEDRFDGVVESPFMDFNTSEIPFHRIRFFKHNGKLVYDRVLRIDTIFTHRKKKFTEHNEI